MDFQGSDETTTSYPTIGTRGVKLCAPANSGLALSSPDSVTFALSRLLQYFCQGQLSFSSWARVQGRLTLATDFDGANNLHINVDEKVIRLADHDYRLSTGSMFMSPCQNEAQVGSESIEDQNMSIWNSERSCFESAKSRDQQAKEQYQTVCRSESVHVKQESVDDIEIKPELLLTNFNNSSLKEEVKQDQIDVTDTNLSVDFIHKETCECHSVFVGSRAKSANVLAFLLVP